MALTEDQRACVEHVGGPLLVSAGAGSGKTFMLTQRIAYALLHPEESGVTDIDQVLAITFTELAASEIKGRVRNKLREEGLADQALKVDACWISTIHGMCSRILHENALELGLDPRFGLLDETDAQRLLDEAIDAALAEVACGERPDSPTSDPDDGGRAAGMRAGKAAVAAGYRDLFELYEQPGSDSTVGAMVRRVVEAAANVRGGLDAFSTRDALSPHEIAVLMHGALQLCDNAAREDIGMNGKPKSASSSKMRDALEGEAGMPRFERLMARRGLAYGDVAQALASFPIGFGSHIRDAALALAYARLKAAYAQLCAEACLGLAQPARDQLLALARRTVELFDAAKARAGKLDQNDLLLKTLDAFERCPAVEAAYRDRFRLVMVDEFQDTSGLQIALIGHLTDGDRRLCTVGDTQQSIYRFRGADVDTYRAHKRHMRSLESSGGMCRELGKNFRSHGDVIAFVNKVFSQDEVFGASGEFIELDWVSDHAATNPFPAVPRIDIVATTGPRGGRGAPGVGSEARHWVEAEAVARRFEALHAAGAKNQAWGDMVILLGRMANAGIYADTLRAHGIPCIIAGGSGFGSTPEAGEVCSLLRAIANPLDDAALRAALTGAAFGLDGSELLRLATTPDGRRRGFWAGLTAQGADDPSPRVRLAADLLRHAVVHAGRTKAADALTELAVASGWLDRLQAQAVQGMAQAANVLKAIRLVGAVEADPDEPRGIVACAARFAHKLDQGMKETPGTLMSEAQDAVRIMTIHASKGLEFPIVALADFYGLNDRAPSLALETVGDTVYLALSAPSRLVGDKAGTPYEGIGAVKLTEAQLARLVDAGEAPGVPAAPEDAETAAELCQAIAAHARAEELGELRRKFYVGATRPREALIIAVNCEDMAKSATVPYKDVVADLGRGLYGSDAEFATTAEGIGFGGETRAQVERIRLGRAEDGTLLMNGEPAGAFLMPQLHGRIAGAQGGQGDGGAAENPAAPAAPKETSVGGIAEGGKRETVLVPAVPAPGNHPGELVTDPEPCDPLRQGTFSYSALAPARMRGDDPDEVAARPAAPLVFADAEEAGVPAEPTEENSLGETPSMRPAGAGATAFGSAFHLACQWMVEQLVAARATGPGEKDTIVGATGEGDDRGVGVAAADQADLPMPDAARLAALARPWHLPPDALPVLHEAVARWAASDIAREALGYRRLEPEAPFFATLPDPQGIPFHLEGSIDLLCRGNGAPAGQTALVVDYKTGGTAGEAPEELHVKHLLQATCYAYAVLDQGYAAVDLAFVRVQQRDPARPDQPQTVRYRFERAQLPELARTIRDAREKREGASAAHLW